MRVIVRSETNNADIPAIAVTAFTHAEARRHALYGG
jgi:hypothetical protein